MDQKLLGYMLVFRRKVIDIEINNAKINTKFGIIMINKMFKMVILQYQLDRDVFLWYLESIYNVVMKLIYNRILIALD